MRMSGAKSKLQADGENINKQMVPIANLPVANGAAERNFERQNFSLASDPHFAGECSNDQAVRRTVTVENGPLIRKQVR